MAELTAENIAQRAFDLNLIDQRQLNEIWSDAGGREMSVEDLSQVLLRKEFMTNFQLERLLRGERAGYYYGDYKVLYLVAGGSFARVYRSVHKDTGKVVALKVLRRRYSDDPQQADHFHREGQVGLALRHPNIVPIYEVYSKGSLHFFVMEFVEGQNLRNFLAVRRKLDPVEATNLAIQLVSGLRYAADRGVMHRDLKMTNVLISSRGQAKIIDFGLAAADAKENDAFDLDNARTIDYAGLERSSGVRKDDPRSDIFFMGCIFYNLLTGRPPLQETRDRIQRLAKTRYADIPPVHQVEATVPIPVSAIVNRAIEFDPERRYQSFGEMLIDLEVAAKRLAAGETMVDAASPEDLQAERDRIAARLVSEDRKRALMIVESDVRTQDVFREAFKQDGYRVLVISDPARALARFEDSGKPAECVIFCSSGLGDACVEAYCNFAENETTRDIAAVLLLDKALAKWVKKVKPLQCEHRVAVMMPVKLRQLREIVARLLPFAAP